jgi:hypothetical protein
MDVGTAQLIIFLAIVIGAFLKQALQYVADGELTIADVSALVAALVVSILIGNQVITTIELSTIDLPSLLSVIITAFALGWSAVSGSNVTVKKVKAKVAG